MSKESDNYDWRRLLGWKIVYEHGVEKKKGTLEVTTESVLRSKTPFCIKYEGSSLIYFCENRVRAAYEGSDVSIYFVDDNGEKIINFL